MQSFMDTAGPVAGPLSPSSLFTFDGESMMSNNGNGNNNDDGVDLFRYYLDLQAFQSKDNGAYNNGGAGLSNALDNTDTNSSGLSPYNAFFNPSAYSSTPSRPSPSTSSTSLLSSISQPGHATQEPSRSMATINTGEDDPSNNSNNLFPFAEAFTHSQQQQQSSYDSDVNPSSILSFDHLAGSENPQPIDPHLLMGNNSNTTSMNTSSILPTVKEEEVEETSPTFPLNGAGFPLMNAPLNNATNSASTSTSNQHQRQQRSASAVSHFDESMNGIDGLSEEDDSENDSEEEEEVAAPTSRKRGSAATSAQAKKRTSATKSSIKKASSSSKRETSIFNQAQQQHPHALVPVPEYEDRLSKAEYDKLSSKEKRQMRNKISARNFRHRRKAHIDTLEALVDDKDRHIRVLSEEVGTLRTENQGLRADIEVLKKNWESIAAKIGAASISAPVQAAPLTPSQHQHHHLTPDEDDLYGAPGSLPALSPAASSSAESTNGDHLSELSFEQARSLAQTQGQAQAQASAARPSTSTSTSTTSSSTKGRVTRSSIQRPNLRKDLGPSGASFSTFGSGRTMNVHTTLIPELNFNFPVPPASLASSYSPPTTVATASTDAIVHNVTNNTVDSGRTSPTSIGSGSIADMLAGKRERDANTSNNVNARLNMNPALNGLTPDQIANLREQFFNANSTMLPSPPPVQEENLSGKVARNNASLDPLQNSFFDTNPFISLRQDSLQDYRAQLYAKLANNVAGIHQAQQTQQKTNSNSNEGNGMDGLRPAFFAGSPAPAMAINEKDAEVAKIASIAQKTLFDKLSTAFWDAFAGNNTTATRSMVPTSTSEMKARRSSTSSLSEMDGQKVADLLAGRSKMQIVSVVDQEKEVDSLARQVESMALKK